MDCKRVGKVGFSFSKHVLRPDNQTIQTLKKFSTPNISDGLNKFCSLHYQIKPISQNTYLVGPAFTVRLRPGDNLMAHKAIDLAQSGDVIVIDAGGCSTNAVWGELMTLAAMCKGVAGLVIDGAIRDVEENRRLNFPIFTRYIVPTSGDKDGPGEINIPISCGGVPVCPGDIIVGDDNGVIVIPLDIVKEVIANIEKKISYEEKRKEEIRAGIVISQSIDKILKEKGVLD